MSADDSLITYPSDFPIKVMGARVEEFEATMIEVARRFDPTLAPERVERRESSGGRWVGLTLTVRATSRQQLDDLYRALSSHPLVKVVL